ncbi:MAG: hypothetical protein R3B06_09165 [Kofleriaceae bacterium]
MLWVLLGVAAIVSAFVVVGVVIDRRLPLLPPAVEPTGAGGSPPPPAAPAPVERRAGETAATAVRVPAAWRAKLAPGTCACGEPLAIASDEALRFDGEVLIVVRLACAACGHTRSVYLAPADA